MSSELKDYEPCEMCGVDVDFGFSLCGNCSDKVLEFDEETGNYLMKNGEVMDTTKGQF